MAMMELGDCELRCELDSHSDTMCAGNNCLLIEHIGEQVNVQPFSGTYKPIANIPVGTAATAYDCPDGTVMILVFHQALCFGDKLKGTLLCPNQMRSNGVVIENCPSQFDPRSGHCIRIPVAGVAIPLEMDGVISYFRTRVPTWEEYHGCECYLLTLDMTWEPYSTWFAEQEELAHESRSTS